jgi:hypothetical protein
MQSGGQPFRACEQKTSRLVGKYRKDERRVMAALSAICVTVTVPQPYPGRHFTRLLVARSRTPSDVA